MQEFELIIDKIASGGAGLGFYRGKAVFVPFSTPQDRLAVKTVEEKKDFFTAEIVRILEPSPQRVRPQCPKYYECGGCNLMHIDHAAQLTLKKAVLEELFHKNSINPVPRVTITSGMDLAYRNRAQFHFSESFQPGFSARNSNRIVPLDNCPLLVEPINMLLAQNSPVFWQELQTKIENPKRFNVFSESSGKAYLEGFSDSINASVLGKNFSFDIRGFFQSNVEMLERLIEQAAEGISGELAADLYSGVGIFAWFMKDAFDRIICVEQDQRAMSHAFRNNGSLMDYSAGSVEAWLESRQAKRKFGHVLVDPPRTGLGKKVLSWLLESRPESIGYVSCNPVSLARDGAILIKECYQLDETVIFDFYPQTSHMESYARFILR